MRASRTFSRRASSSSSRTTGGHPEQEEPALKHCRRRRAHLFAPLGDLALSSARVRRRSRPLSIHFSENDEKKYTSETPRLNPSPRKREEACPTPQRVILLDDLVAPLELVGRQQVPDSHHLEPGPRRSPLLLHPHGSRFLLLSVLVNPRGRPLRRSTAPWPP